MYTEYREKVYDELEKHGRIVGGGRGSNLGVGGFLLGGGISYLSPHQGFSCDGVIAYDVALADGSIIAATPEHHETLFRVLKGAGNNFGLVTRFTLTTFPLEKPYWGGVSMKAADTMPAAAQALQHFTSRSAEDPDTTLILVASHRPEYGGPGVMTIGFNSMGMEQPKALRAFMDIPELFSKYETGNINSVSAFNALPLNHL